ncbi:MAG: chorismate mutase [Pleurocapsa sp. SU_5_0]|nr:chorismate mutase [Pleurocapsa sp. SU_5_0]NJR45083.1 chorismate mutase [Hyellaceae cyanobacterium CSU_1_1]
MNQLKYPVNEQQQTISPPSDTWRVRGLRGATTVSRNSVAAITQAVNELLDILITENQIAPDDIASVFFSVTSDLNALFPAAIARQRPGWEYIPLLDLQHLDVANSLERCIRILIHLNTPLPQKALRPVYLNQAVRLRPDLAISG